MLNELRELMRDASSHPPQDPGDVGALLGAGRRRVRVRRAGIVGGTALAAGAITLASMAWFDPAPADLAAAGVPRAQGTVIGLADAAFAVEGTDYRELASHTNEDLDADNGQYFDGVTDDGLVLFRDGPRSDQLYPRFALMDTETGEKDWLPVPRDLGQSQTYAVELSAERLVLVSLDDVGVHVFDRTTRQWTRVTWPTLPRTSQWVPRLPSMGPDGRLYIQVLATRGTVPEGGWPMGPDGEADDAGAEGDTFDLWSVSVTDSSDVRDEGLRVGAIAFTQDSLVWTDSENGAAGRVHVRDLASGEETSFDPELGERCNLLGFSAAGDRIAMSQYCGTYADGVRDDRLQVVTTDGDQVVTLQDTGIAGGHLIGDGDAMTVTSYDRATGGTYVYDVDEGRLVRLSEGHSSWEVGTGPTPGDTFMWSTPAGGRDLTFGRRGAEVHLGELIR
jgi:hypothetical protein